MHEPAPQLSRGPFRGLAPFDTTDVDALFFFGRGHEQDVLIANLISFPLTVLYGPSGVGKSSLLRAGVAHRLLEIANGDVRRQGRPEF
ncbi:MAG: hypothetical protein ABI649_05980, partial [Gaiellaceae bacterium]